MTTTFPHPIQTLDKKHWYLLEKLAFLNHGSFGACPKVIIQQQRAIQQELETSPVAFYLRTLTAQWIHTKQHLASLIHAQADHLLLVPNASEGVSTFLHNITWQAGDEIVVSNHAYPACRHMLSVLSQRKGIVVKIAYTTFAHFDVHTNAEHSYIGYHQIVEAYEAQITERTRCLFIEHISSPTALCFPVEALIHLAKRHNILSIVDAAHAIGQVHIDLQSWQPDFYISNTHKWLLTPKSCAFLYVAPQHHAHFYPLVVSHGYIKASEIWPMNVHDTHAHQDIHSDPTKRIYQGTQALFEWTGTRDYSAYLCIPHTVEWIEKYCGSVDQMIQSNHLKLIQARTMILHAWWGDQIDSLQLPPVDFLASMCTIPVPPIRTLDQEGIKVGVLDHIHPLQEYLYQHDIEIPVIKWQGGVQASLPHESHSHPASTPSLSDPHLNAHTHNQRLCIRISAQLYNTVEDYQRLIQCIEDLRV